MIESRQKLEQSLVLKDGSTCAEGTAYPDEGLKPVGREPFPNWSTEEPHLCNLSRGDTFPYLQKGTIYANSLGTR